MDKLAYKELKMSNYYLFLDDQRYPNSISWVKIPQNIEWTIVRNYDQFISTILAKGFPHFICYDHDLADCHYKDAFGNKEIDYNKYSEKTGYDCAKWLVQYCVNRNVKHPPFIVHSLNPIGKKNIELYIESYNKTL